MTGALQRVMFWSGVPTITQLNALPVPQTNITIVYPVAPQTPVITTNPLLIELEVTDTFQTVNPAALATNATNAVVTLGAPLRSGQCRWRATRP